MRTSDACPRSFDPSRALARFGGHAHRDAGAGVRFGSGLVALALGLALSVGPATPACADEAARIDDAASSRQLLAVPRKAGARPVVAIYDVRSAVPDVQPNAAREMFMTALVKSGAFTVAERVRLEDGVMKERQLEQQGISDGQNARSQVSAARYVFEVVISESNTGAKQDASSVSVGGMQVSSSGSSDQLGMDVRIVDTRSGNVVDAVNVVKKVESSDTQVSGVGNLVGTLGAMFRKNVPVPVDVGTHTVHKDGVDRALRSCIEVAVAELALRLNAD